jgi:hypothetical protein
MCCEACEVERLAIEKVTDSLTDSEKKDTRVIVT